MYTAEDWDLFHVHLFPNSLGRLILRMHPALLSPKRPLTLVVLKLFFFSCSHFSTLPLTLVSLEQMFICVKWIILTLIKETLPRLYGEAQCSKRFLVTALIQLSSELGVGTTPLVKQIMKLCNLN